jgi:hypothetical protein
MLKTEIWVQAFMRRCQAENLFGAVLHKGSAEAGAVFIIINHLNGTCDVLGPPPGSAFDEAGNRRFLLEFKTPVLLHEAETLLKRRRSFDSDLWAIEIEDRHGLAGITPEK